MFGGLIYPQVVDIKPLEQWPDAGRVLYHIDTFAYEYWWISASVVIGAITAYFYSLKRWVGPLRNRFDRFPLMWRNRRDMRAALLIVSLAGLFDSNLTLRAAINRVAKTSDPWMRWHLNTMSKRLTQRPDQPMRALDTGIFSEMIVDTITDASGRDQFEAAIKSLGRESLDRVVEAVKRNARLTHYMLARLCGHPVPYRWCRVIHRHGRREHERRDAGRGRAVIASAAAIFRRFARCELWEILCDKTTLRPIVCV